MDACVYDGCIGGQLMNAGEAVEDVMTVEDCHNACQSKVGCKWFKFSYGRYLYTGKPICSIVSDIAWAGSDTQDPNSAFDTTYTHFLSCPMASTVASSTRMITSTTKTTTSTTGACPGYCPDGNSINWTQCKDYYMDACVYDGCIGGQLMNAGEAVEDVTTVEDCHNACLCLRRLHWWAADECRGSCGRCNDG